MKSILAAAVVVILLVPWSTSAATGRPGDPPSGSVNDTCARIDSYLAQLARERGFSGGMLIVRNGEKLLCKGYGWADKERGIPFDATTLASMGSITKAFTAAAIMKLVELGKLSVDDRLAKFFPQVPPDKAGITIHQLLTHSSGFHEFLQNDGGDYEKLPTDEFLKRVFAEPLSFMPGEKAVYTNVGMSMLGIIIEQVTGETYEAFLRKNLFDPAGIHGIGYHVTPAPQEVIAHGYDHGHDWGTIPQRIAAAGSEPYWNLKANGGLEASLNEMFLWSNAITRHAVLSEASIEKMFTPHVPEQGYDGRSYFGYGCTIQKSRRNTKVIDNGGSNGIYFARLVRLPEEGLVFYLVTNESSVNANKVLPNIFQLYFEGAISRDALNQPAGFDNPLSAKVYEIVLQPNVVDVQAELRKRGVTVDDDMVLLEVGRKLTGEGNLGKAQLLYEYYTGAFPGIVVAWNDLADIYLALGRKEDAKRCFREALHIRPTNPRAKEALEKLR